MKVSRIEDVFTRFLYYTSLRRHHVITSILIITRHYEIRSGNNDGTWGTTPNFQFSLWDSKDWVGHVWCNRFTCVLSILFMRFIQTPKPNIPVNIKYQAFNSLYEIRGWLQRYARKVAEELSILFMRFLKHLTHPLFHSPLTFNSLYEILSSINWYADACTSFQFSLWDSKERSWSKLLIWHYFQFSLWDSCWFSFAWLFFKYVLLSILFMRFFTCSHVSRVSRNGFQFSLWDSSSQLSLETWIQQTFQFSLWDSR